MVSTPAGHSATRFVFYDDHISTRHCILSVKITCCGQMVSHETQNLLASSDGMISAAYPGCRSLALFIETYGAGILIFSVHFEPRRLFLFLEL